MKSSTTNRFWKCYNGLPEEVRKQAKDAYGLFPSDPYYPSLHFKRILLHDLSASPSEVPVHEWQKKELARRKANLMRNPTSGLSWVAVKRNVRSRYGR